MVRSTRTSPRTQRQVVVKEVSFDETTKAEFGYESMDNNADNRRFCFQNKFIYCCCVLGTVCVMVSVFVTVSSTTLLQNESPITFLRKAAEISKAHIENAFQFQITSPAFMNGDVIPSKYNETISPPLEFSYKPPNTQSYALVVEDIDTFNRRKHWIVYNIPSDVKGFKEGVLVLPEGSSLLFNDFNSQRYSGPSFTYREHKHRYMFRLMALNVSNIEISISTNTNYVQKYSDLQKAMNPYIIKEATIIGTYGNTPEGHRIAFAA